MPPSTQYEGIPEAPDLYFWRDNSGHEVDLLREDGAVLTPFEIKSGRTVVPDFFTGLRRWVTIAGDAAGQPYLVYGGDERQIRSGVTVLPWRALGQLER